MDKAILSIIIMGLALAMYCVPRLPVWITSCTVMVAMVWTGCLDYATAYSGFGNKVIFLIAGMAIMGQACVTTGLAARVGYLLSRLVGDSEKKTVFLVIVLAGVMGVFLNGSLVVAILMPVIDCVVLRSGGRITRKHTYFPLGIAAAAGNGLTSFSASSMVTCVGILTAAGYREMGLFEPLAVAGPAFLAFEAFYMLWGYRLSQRWFDFPDPPVAAEGVPAEYDASLYPLWKQWVTGLTILAVMTAMVLGGNFGAWPIMGAAVVILTGCISEKSAILGVNWTTIITVGAAIGFSNALTVTGGGDIVARFFMNIAGPLGESLLGMSVILLVIAAVMSSLLSDNGAVSCIIPIAMAIARSNGWDPFPLVIATAFGLKVCQFFTPICVGCVTQTLSGGQRAKDYLRLGGLISLINGVVVVIMLAIVY